MSRLLLFTLGCLAAAFLAVGCSSDTPTQPDSPSAAIKAVISGEVDPAAPSFEFEAPGEFKIQGSNLRYVPDPGTLLVDIQLVNLSAEDQEGPARLVFMQLLPEYVTILNPDNADSAMGAGALFEFQFADDDTLWRAGTATDPRTVQFGVAPGTSIAFVARVLAGEEPVGGTVGGLVWHDVNEDGVVDDGENGVRNIRVTLHAGTAPDPAKRMMEAVTDTSGHYSFGGLAAGHYTVALAQDDRIRPTTPPVLEVLLVEYDGQVADFMDADFGVTRAGAPDTTECIVEDACINAKGAYVADRPHLDTEILCVCDPEREFECEDEDDDADKCDDNECWGRLSGPITDIDFEGQRFAVMGTWVHLPEMDWDKGDHNDYDLGFRVRVNAKVVEGQDGDMVVACRIHKWDGHRDRVRGHIQEVIRDEDGVITAVKVLNTLVSVPEGFECGDCYNADDDCDGGHDYDHDHEHDGDNDDEDEDED